MQDFCLALGSGSCDLGGSASQHLVRLRVRLAGGVSEACPGHARGGAKTAEAAPLGRARGRACCIAAAAAPLGSSLPTMAAPSPSGGGGSGGGSGSGTPGPVGSPASGHPAVSSMQGKERGSAETSTPWRGRRRRRGLSPRPRTPPERPRKPPELPAPASLPPSRLPTPC